MKVAGVHEKTMNEHTTRQTVLKTAASLTVFIYIEERIAHTAFTTRKLMKNV